MAGQIKFSSDIPRFWPVNKILNFQVFKRGKLFAYPCLKHHTHAPTSISYISETGILLEINMSNNGSVTKYRGSVRRDFT